MVAPWPVIVQPFRRTIGRSGNGARSVGAADDLGREMVDRHNGRYTALLSAGRQRCISAHSHSLPFACLTSPHFLIGTVPRARYRATLRRSEEHTSALQSLMRISYAVFCLKKKNHKHNNHYYRD